jgi:steroid 5-alpha reductase family enzyme
MKQKPKDLIVILIIYMIALAAAVLTLKYVPVTDMLWKTAIADVVATVVIFIFSFIYKNSSIYDPYWSAAPVFIVFYWLYQSDSFDFIFKIMWVLIIIWGVRLTWNWILRWDGMEDEDWRYVDIRKKTGKNYWVASFFGIHFMPTILVFLGLIPVYYGIFSIVSPFDSWLATIAFLFTLSAIYLEKTADDELRRFIKSGRSETERIQSGWWIVFKYPNYVGEISFWWGLYLFALAVDRGLWWTIFGPASITLMFLFISMPMMKKHLVNKIYK